MRDISFTDTFLANGDTLPRLNGEGPTVSFVSPGYFAAMGMRVLQGRDLASDDRVGSEPVVIVNSTLAQTVWRGESAIGRCFALDKPTNPCRRIVGVVSNAHHNSVVEAPSLQFFIPLAQQGFDDKPTSPGSMEIRTAPGRVGAVASEVQRLLLGMVGPGMKPWTRSFSVQLAPQLRNWRLGAALFTSAGILALLVAAVGIYGTIAYTFSQRTHEMGVRIALGAPGASIIRLVLKSSLLVSAIGVAIGTGIIIWAARFAKPLLYETSPNDPFVLGGVVFVLLGVAIVASVVPAMRAKGVDPIAALRAD